MLTKYLLVYNIAYITSSKQIYSNFAQVFNPNTSHQATSFSLCVSHICLSMKTQ